MSKILIRGGRVILPEGVQEGWDVALEGGRILQVGPHLATAGARVVEAQDMWVTPGLLDTHLHGVGPDDVMDASLAALQRMSLRLARHGVTAWLPTTVASAPTHLARVLETIAEACRTPAPGALVLGAHLESNFLSPAYRGAQPAQYLLPPDDPIMVPTLEAHAATIRLITLAPERPGALRLIWHLRARGIRVAVGHSDATYDEVMQAVEAGATRVTHLCNAQRGFHHREPGVLGAGLASEALSCEIIADGHHVHPAGLVIARKCKGAEHLILVSDALRGTGLPPGRYELGGQVTLLDGEVARLENGTIAGSTIMLDRAVRTMMSRGGATPWEAVTMATLAPARAMGWEDRGRLVPGAIADVVLWDEDWQPCTTWIRGLPFESAEEA